jgi:large subunit ribosomal protein L17
MRHRQTTSKLNRNVGNRKSLIRNLLCQLYLHEGITTTLSKAKIIQSFAEQQVKSAQTQTLHHHRLLLQQLNNPQIVHKLINKIAPQYSKKTGFTRIIKVGHRMGDHTLMAKLLFTKPDNLQISTPVPSTTAEQISKTTTKPKSAKKYKTKSKTIKTVKT